MFEARLEQGVVFKKIVESIKDIVKSVNIDASSSGLSMQAMDQSHVALVSLNLNEGGFDSFRCEKQLTLGLQIENLSKILKVAGNDDTICISAEDEEPSQLKFLFESKKGDKVSIFNLNLIQIDSEQLGIPETQYPSIVTMPSAEFSRICKELNSLSETMTIETTKEAVKFSVNGEIGSGEVTIKDNEGEKPDEHTTLEVTEPVNLSFALRYLNMFNKAAVLSDKVILQLSNDSPLVVEFQIKKLGSLKFFLAPKINDEEEGGN